jgi:hypothetical protein
VPANAGALVTTVNDEIMAFWLATNCFIYSIRE